MLQLLILYKGIAHAQAQLGETILFWKNMWNDRLLHTNFPHLFSFALDDNITLKSVLAQVSLQDIFHLPVSEKAFSEFCELDIFIQSFQTTDVTDSWSYIWSSNSFSSRKAYNHLIGSQPVHPTIKWLWASSCQLKHKVFFWLLHNNRLSTRGLLRRKNMYLESYT
jgi:hypothetical protein